jgi:hypothetical protein
MRGESSIGLELNIGSYAMRLRLVQRVIFAPTFAFAALLQMGCSSFAPQAEKLIPPKQTLVSGQKVVPLTPTQYRFAREAVNSLESMKKQYLDGDITFQSMQMSTSRAGKDVDAALAVLPSDADVTHMLKASMTGYRYALMVWAAVIGYKGENGKYDRSAQQETLAEVDQLFQTKGLPPKKKLERILSLSNTATDNARKILDQAGQ